MTDNLLIFQASVGVKGLSLEETTRGIEETRRVLEKELQQDKLTVKVLVTPDISKEFCVDIKLVYPVYNLVDKDYQKHVELYEEINKIKKELDNTVD